MDTTLVILAAGLGSRFGGDKQISHVGPHGEILMEYSIRDAIDAGFNRVVFILKRDMVETVKNGVGKRLEKLVEVEYAVQDFTTLPAFYRVPEERTKPFGTVHAVLAAADAIKTPFATVNADDYYGKDAFRILHEMLTGLRDGSQACMVPYILGNTMSENGGVTRGICTVRNGFLSEVTETYHIHYTDDRSIVSDSGVLRSDAVVSMNIWGFHPALLREMKTYFENFLQSLPTGEIKAECLLPIMVNDFLSDGRISVRAIASADKWFGITFPADRETVMEQLRILHGKGDYPEILFAEPSAR